MKLVDMITDRATTMPELYAMYMDFRATDPGNHAETFRTELYNILMDTVNGRNDFRVDYLTPAEAEKIVAQMEPKAPWSREQWKDAMEKFGFPLEEWPCFNRCALYVTMNMIMSDSSKTLSNFVQGDNLFKMVYGLAVDKLKDQDEMFNVRVYFYV